MVTYSQGMITLVYEPTAVPTTLRRSVPVIQQLAVVVLTFWRLLVYGV